MVAKKYHDLVGKKFGALTIIALFMKHNGLRSATYAKCLCDCGTTFDRILSTITRTKYKTISCGCLQILGMVNRRKLKYGYEPIEKPTQIMIDAANKHRKK